LREVVGRFFPTVTVDAEAARDVGFGRSLTLELAAEGPVAVVDEVGTFLGLYRRAGDRTARPVSVFV